MQWWVQGAKFRVKMVLKAEKLKVSCLLKYEKYFETKIVVVKTRIVTSSCHPISSLASQVLQRFGRTGSAAYKIIIRYLLSSNKHELLDS